MNETAQEVDANPLDGKRVKMYRDFFLKEDVAAAVAWFDDKIQHTDDDWEDLPEDSKAGRIDMLIPHAEQCRHCGMPKPLALEKGLPCPVKVEDKLDKAFADVLDESENPERDES